MGVVQLLSQIPCLMEIFGAGKITDLVQSGKATGNGETWGSEETWGLADPADPVFLDRLLPDRHVEAGLALLWAGVRRP